MKYCPILLAVAIDPESGGKCIQDSCEWYQHGCPAHPDSVQDQYGDSVEQAIEEQVAGTGSRKPGWNENEDETAHGEATGPNQ